MATQRGGMAGRRLDLARNDFDAVAAPRMMRDDRPIPSDPSDGDRRLAKERRW